MIVEARQERLTRSRWSTGDLRIPFAGRDDLTSMKRASGTPADLGDVAALTEPDESSR